MTTKNKPATPLPWRHFLQGDSTRFLITENKMPAQIAAAHVPASLGDGAQRDAAYIAHAANAYPKLVAALRDAAQEAYIAPNQGERFDEGFKAGWDHALNLVHVKMLALLRELGEAE